MATAEQPAGEALSAGLSPEHPNTAVSEANEQGEKNANERLLLFSDGVMAIAITLGALTIKISSDPPQLLSQIQDDLIKYCIYIFSFLLVAIYWNEHRRVFHYIKRNDIPLVLLNFIFLASIVVIPLGLYFTEESFKADTTTLGYAVILFLGSSFCAGISLVALWIYVCHKRRLVDAETERHLITYNILRLLIYPLIYLVTTISLYLDGTTNNGWYLLAIPLFLVIWLIVLRIFRHGMDIFGGRHHLGRLLLFSYAVFGIGVTIAIAQIEIPPVANITLKELVQLLNTNWQQVHAYVVGIVIVGIFWLFHYRLFRYVNRIDGWLVFLNFWFLLCIALMFMPINLFSTYWSNPGARTYAEVFLGVNLFFAALILCLIWRHAAHKRRLLDPKGTDSQIRRFGIGVVGNLLIFLVLTLIPFAWQPRPLVYLALYLTALVLVLLYARWHALRADSRQVQLA